MKITTTRMMKTISLMMHMRKMTKESTADDDDDPDINDSFIKMKTDPTYKPRTWHMATHSKCVSRENDLSFKQFLSLT